VLKKVYVTIFMHITMMSRIYTDSGEEEEDWVIGLYWVIAFSYITGTVMPYISQEYSVYVYQK
jgi:hypothetical protein